jgi:hypothetical protein
VPVGENGELISIAPDHWVHGFIEKLEPLLAPFLDKSGETGVCRTFADVDACSEHAASVCTLHLSVLVDA